MPNNVRKSAYFGVMGGLGWGLGLGPGGCGGCGGDDWHLQVWLRGGSGMLTSQETPSTPSQLNVPRQPTAHIVPSGKHPKVLPSTHSAIDICFVQAHAGAGAGEATAVAAVVQFMIGVVNIIGEARMAHIENSVMASSSVTFGGPSVGSNPLAGPVPVCSMSRSFQPYGCPVLKPQIGHSIGFQAPISTRSAWAPSRSYHTARVGARLRNAREMVQK